MAKQFVTLTAKTEKSAAEKFRSLAEKNGETISGLINKLVTQYISDHEKPLYMCDACNDPLGEGASYYCELENWEKVVKNRKGELEVDTWDSRPARILCMDCAAKIGRKRRAKLAKPTHKMRDEAKVRVSERREK